MQVDIQALKQHAEEISRDGGNWSMSVGSKDLLSLIAELKQLRAAKAAPAAPEMDAVAWCDESESKLWWVEGHPARSKAGKRMLYTSAPAPAAPVDLSALVRWDRTDDGMVSVKGSVGRFVEFDDVRALLAAGGKG